MKTKFDYLLGNNPNPAQGPVIATRGFYGDNNGVAYWKGLPLPRTEYLPNGEEYFMFLDKDNMVNILDNKIHTTSLDMVNPLTGLSIGRKPVDLMEMVNIRRGKNIRAYYEAPKDSYLHNVQISNVVEISTPNLESTSVTEDLPSEFRKPSVPIDIPSIAPERRAFSRAPMEEIDLAEALRAPYPRFIPAQSHLRPISPDATPRASTSQLPDITPDATPRASTSQLPDIIPSATPRASTTALVDLTSDATPRASTSQLPDITSKEDVEDFFDRMLAQIRDRKNKNTPAEPFDKDFDPFA
jgi:hypothetical protein